MENEKQYLFEDIKKYSLILDDYVNKRFNYTLNTEYLEDEIKSISACLIETVNDFEQLLIEEEQNNCQGQRNCSF